MSPCGVADLQLLDVFGPDAEAGVGLDVDLPGAAELVEVVDVVAAQVDLEGVEDVAQGHAHRLALGAVDVDVELRRRGAEHGEQADQPRLGVALLDQVVDLASAVRRGRCRRRSSTISLKPPALPRPSTGGAPKTPIWASSISANNRRRSLAAIASAPSSAAVALVERLEDHEHRGEVRAVGVQQERLPGDGHGVLHAGDAAGDLLHLPRDGLRSAPARRSRAVGR